MKLEVALTIFQFVEHPQKFWANWVFSGRYTPVRRASDNFKQWVGSVCAASSECAVLLFVCAARSKIVGIYRASSSNRTAKDTAHN